MTELESNSDLEEFADAAVRRLRLIRIGLKNQDQMTLDAVKKDLQSEWGDLLGAEVFDELLFREIMEINKDEMEEKYPELKGKL